MTQEDCLAHGWGCSCPAGHCRADLPAMPPKPKPPRINEVLAFIIMAVVISFAAYVGLSRAEAAYQVEQV